MIVLASAREDVRASLLGVLAAEGYGVLPASDWPGLCRAVVDTRLRVALIDPELPGLRPELLAALSASLPHSPPLYVLGAALPPLPRLAATSKATLRAARKHAGASVVPTDTRRALLWAGLGPAPLTSLARVAAANRPVLLVGETGTGKERLARVLHQLSARRGPFVELAPEAPLRVEDRRAGTFYVAAAQRRPDLGELARQAVEARWGFVAGTRAELPPRDGEWLEVRLPPLRERPDDLRGLAQHYVDDHAARLGLGRRAFDRALWAAMHTHRWPQNARELEGFVVAVLTAVDAPILRLRDLPEAVRERLLGRHDEVAGELEAFEQTVEARLAPVVSAYTPGHGRSLWELVATASGRALVRLVLARTQGNRKAAAALLGVARNTLQADMQRYGLSARAR